MRNKLIYWIPTALFAFAMGASAVFDLMHPPELIEGIKKLGYPEYLATILGGWKLLGTVAILVPRMPRLKEWAYAGFFFDLTGAALSHAFCLCIAFGTAGLSAADFL